MASGKACRVGGERRSLPCGRSDGPAASLRRAEQAASRTCAARGRAAEHPGLGLPLNLVHFFSLFFVKGNNSLKRGARRIKSGKIRLGPRGNTIVRRSAHRVGGGKIRPGISVVGRSVSGQGKIFSKERRSPGGRRKDPSREYPSWEDPSRARGKYYSKGEALAGWEILFARRVGNTILRRGARRVGGGQIRLGPKIRLGPNDPSRPKGKKNSQGEPQPE